MERASKRAATLESSGPSLRHTLAGKCLCAVTSVIELPGAGESGGRLSGARRYWPSYFSSATCTVSEPSTVRILARSAWD